MASCKGPGRFKVFTGGYRETTFPNGQGGWGHGREAEYYWAPCPACGIAHGGVTGVHVLLILLALVGLVLLALGIGVVVADIQEGDRSNFLGPEGAESLQEPSLDGLGEPSAWLLSDCGAGIMGACDLLREQNDSDSGRSDVDEYARTCGRRRILRAVAPECATQFADQGAIPAIAPPTDLGENSDLDLMAIRCFAGNFVMCDNLALESDPYRSYGTSCGGRNEDTQDRCDDLYAESIV